MNRSHQLAAKRLMTVVLFIAALHTGAAVLHAQGEEWGPCPLCGCVREEHYLLCLDVFLNGFCYNHLPWGCYHGFGLPM